MDEMPGDGCSDKEMDTACTGSSEHIEDGMMKAADKTIAKSIMQISHSLTQRR